MDQTQVFLLVQSEVKRRFHPEYTHVLPQTHKWLLTTPHFKVTVFSLAPSHIVAHSYSLLGPLGHIQMMALSLSLLQQPTFKLMPFYSQPQSCKEVGGLGEWQEISPRIDLRQLAGLKQHPVMVEVVEGFGAAESSLRRIRNSVTKLSSSFFCSLIFPSKPLSYPSFLSCYCLSSLLKTLLLSTALLLTILLLVAILLLHNDNIISPKRKKSMKTDDEILLRKKLNNK